VAESDDKSQLKIVLEDADKMPLRLMKWVWPKRIPLGELTIFAGLPGETKSLVTVDLAARLSTGQNFLDCENLLPPSKTLFISSEDNPYKTLVPRLVAAGADRSKIKVFKHIQAAGRKRSLCLDIDLDKLRDTLKENPDIRLVVIDPVSNHLGKVSMIDEQKIRDILGPLSEIADAFTVAVVGVMHLNKKEGLSAIQRVGGAGAFIGLARASWFFGRQAPSSPIQYMIPLKNNNASRLIKSLAYEIAERTLRIEDTLEQIPYLEWIGEIELAADDVLLASSSSKQRGPHVSASIEKAKEFLQEQLAAGPTPVGEIMTSAEEERVSKRTLMRAKRILGVQSVKKKDVDGGWEWLFPKPPE
jgi:putative DNA primase/helicase